MKINWTGFGLVVVALVVIVAIGYSLAPKQDWLGFYHPNGTDLQHYTTSQHYSSLQACRDWADEEVGNSTTADYECGLNCKFDADTLVYSCEETQD